MRRVLFDSDVLLDVLAQRQPFVVASAQALNVASAIPAVLPEEFLTMPLE